MRWEHGSAGDLARYGRYSYKLTSEVEDPGAVHLALALYRGGMDFANALHLASSIAADRFVTFDRELAEGARSLGALPAVELLAVRSSAKDA